MLANTSVTIYNLVQSLGGDVTAFRHFVPAAWWFKREKISSGDSGSVTANEVVCRIPELAGYASPREWAQLSEEDRRKKWTLCPGDVLVRGSCPLNVYDEDGHRLEDLLSDVEEACTVTRVSDLRFSGVPHVLARGE